MKNTVVGKNYKVRLIIGKKINEFCTWVIICLIILTQYLVILHIHEAAHSTPKSTDN